MVPPHPASPETESVSAFEAGELRRLASVSSEAKAILSHDGRFVRVDSRWESLLGQRADALAGRSLVEFVVASERRSARELFERLREAGTVSGFPLRIRVGRSTVSSLSINACSTPDELCLSARDVSAERATLQRLKSVNRRAESTVEMLKAICRVQGRAVFEDDPTSVFDFLLSEFLRITGSEYGFIGEVRHRDGAPYLKTHAITNVAWNDETLALYRENASKGLEFSNMGTLFGHVIVSKDPVVSNDPKNDMRAGGLPEGHPPMKSFLGLPLADHDGMIGMVGLANRPQGYDRNLIDFIEPLAATCTSCLRASALRQERTRAQDELHWSESRRQQLEVAHMSRVAAAGELAASLAHELNQPLSAILTNARAAQRMREAGDRLDEIDETLTDIVEDASRAGQIIHKLRQFLRKGKLDVRPQSLNEVVSGVVDLLGGVDSVGSQCIRMELEHELPNIEGDRVQLEQVLINLIRNGLEAMDETPACERELLIETQSTPDGSVACSVTDRGPGMTEPEAAFDPFFTTKKSGMGMGLPISRTIIEAHGGHLEFLPSPAGGTCLQFTFPSGQRS